MMNVLRAKVLVCLSLLAFFSASPAHAAGEGAKHSGRAKEKLAKERAAKKACITGDVKTGIEILGDLYVDTGDATYVFNQGRCYEQNHRLEEAVDRFREYLRKIPDSASQEKADANAHIAECEALMGPRAAPASPAPVAQPAELPPPAAAPVQTPVVIQPAAPVPPASDGRGLRIAGIVTAAVGLAAVGTGVALALEERSLTNQINTKFSQSKDSTRKTYETWGYVSYGVGAAALVTGAALYFVGWRAARGEPGNTGVSLLPVLAPDTRSLVLQGSF